MLDSLRRGAQGTVAKVLFLILMLSFVLWGIPRNFLAGNDATIATVGKTDISIDRFKRAFDTQMQEISNREKGRISREMAIQMGLGQNVAERLVGQTALLEEAKKLNMALSDEALAEGVRNDPMFAGVDGKFSKLGYDNFLQQIGLTERGYFAFRREDELRRQLTDTLTTATVVPKPTIELIHAYNEETRTTAHFVIDAIKKVVVADPDDAKLKQTYEDNKTQFMTPEYRKLAVLTVSNEDLKKGVEITDADIKASYEDTKDAYDKPERRRIQQISFKDMASAEAARKAIVENKKNFVDAAKDAGAKESDINLGMLMQKQLIDPAVSKAAFALARDEISQPIDGRFSVLLLRVIEIDPGKMTTLDQVKDLVRDKLATKKTEGLLQEKVNLVEEARNAGKTLKEAGESLKLVFKDVEAVTADNKTPDGKIALDNAEANTILNAAFASSPGAQNDAVRLASGDVAWFDVLGVTAPRQKTLDEAKGLVKDYYIDAEQKKQLNDLATKLTERLKNGEYINKLAEEAGGKVEITESVKRVMSVPGMSQDAVKLAFTLPVDGAANSESADHKSRVVFKVISITPPPPPSKEEAARLTEKLSNELETENLIAYVDGLKSEFGVSMNNTLLKRFTGAEAPQ